MYKIIASIKKEALLLWSDKVGLLLMFFMPLLLVFVITIVQDSAYKAVNENKISIIITNQDSGDQGEKLVELLKNARLFTITKVNGVPGDEMKKKLLEEKKLTALIIPSNFSEVLKEKSERISLSLMTELGLSESEHGDYTIESPNLEFYHDPVLQENYSMSIINVIYSLLATMETELMISSIYEQMGMESSFDKLKERMDTNRIKISRILATNSDKITNPNSTQHNVPAWTIFAMFFMVVSLGSNVVKEKINGSFLRLKTMPTSYINILGAKMLVYMFVAFLQFSLIFSVGMLIFPSLNLPELTLPNEVIALIAVVIFSSLAATSYAIMLGALSKTQEQSNGIGAVSIIIFAALGGIWVPSFIMPEYLQAIGRFSPMHWCLEGFYILFLKGGNWNQLYPILGFIFMFTLVSQTITIVKLKMEKLI